MQTTLNTNCTRADDILYIAFELSDKTWRMASSNRNKRRHKTVTALNQAEVLEEIMRAKAKFQLTFDCNVIVCYEAGWEGFWLARWLQSEGVIVHVVDASAIEVNRRARRVKTDRVDGDKLLNLLLRYCGGEKSALKPLRIPSQEEEDLRHVHRERLKLIKARSQYWIRIKSLLRAQGIRLTAKRGFLSTLDSLRLWNGKPLPVTLKTRLINEWTLHKEVDKRIKALEADQRHKVDTPAHPSHKQVAQLMALRSVGIHSAWPLVMEFFGWRRFRNRRELAALAGLTPTPYQSGDSAREQGISKAGNKRIRSIMVELSWSWLRYQPDSQLSQWYEERFGQHGKRQRRIGIVALARKLLVALWRFLETGAIPDGASLKPA